MAQDPFEQSLRDMLQAAEGHLDDDASLNKVLKKANRQLFSLATVGIIN